MRVVHSTQALYSLDILHSKDLDLHDTSATHLHGHTLGFIFTWNQYNSESLNIIIAFS